MPIRPEQRRLYPRDWPERRARILARAAGTGKIPRCEHCGVHQYAVGYRNEDGSFVPNAGNGPCDASGRGQDWPGGSPLTYAYARAIADVNNNCVGGTDDDGNRWIVIVLTVAHLDRTGPRGLNDGPLDCPDDRLAALCQRCHLLLDAVRHVTNAYRTRFERKALGDLFDTLSS